LSELPLIGPRLQDYWGTVAAGEANFAATLKPYVSTAGGWLFSVLASFGGGILELVLSLVIAFFLYREGGIAGSRLYAFSSRIGSERATRALDVAGGTIKGVVYGIVGTNLIQGVLSGIGFWVAGVPGAFLLGFLCFFLTMVPLAPTFIWLPSSLYLFYNGSTGMAIALAIWSFLIFNPLENVLRPYLISRGSDLPILLILLGMLGGLAAFGLLGIFVGPTILAVGYGLLIDWIEPSSQPSD
jgi:predicted PurR-regulated permease PerM